MIAVPSNILRCDCRKENYFIWNTVPYLGSLPQFCYTSQKISQQIKKKMLLFQEVFSLKYIYTQKIKALSLTEENVLTNIKSTSMYIKPQQLHRAGDINCQQ